MNLVSITIVILVAACSILGTLLYVESRKRKVPSRAGEKSDENRSIPCEVESALAKPESKGNGLQFESRAGQIAFEIKVPSQNFKKSRDWKQIDIGKSSADWLQPCLSQAVEVLKIPVLAKLGSSRTFHVVFKGGGELMRAKSGDGFRAVLIDRHSHHIVSQGLLQPVISNPANLLLVWECAAAIVGRKYLADINRNLNVLKASVRNVEEYLRDERSATLESDCYEIERIGNAVRKDPSYLYRTVPLQNSLETIRRNAVAAARALLREMDRHSEGLRTVTDLTGFRNAPTEQVTEPVDKVLNAIKVAAMAVLVGAYCCALSASYLDDDDIRVSRSREVDDIYEKVSDALKRIESLAAEKVEQLDEFLRFQKHVDEVRRAVREPMRPKFFEAAQALRSTRAVLKSTKDEKNLLQRGREDIEVLVTADKAGNILRLEAAT